MEYKEYELLIDVDFKPEIVKFAKEFAYRLYLLSRMGVYTESVEVYETNKGLHIYVYVYSKLELDNKDIIILQLILNSDYKRELFNFKRVKSGIKKGWNVLFKVKFENGKKVSEEKSTPYSIRLTKLINLFYNKLDNWA